MTERDIGKAFVTVMTAALTAQGRSGVKLFRAFTAQQQSATKQVAIFFAPVVPSDIISVVSIAKPSEGVRKTQTTSRETYQFTAVKTATQGDTDSAFDTINLLYKLVNSYDGIRNLLNQGINIEKSRQIRHDWVENESGGRDDYASFDLTFYVVSEIEESMNTTGTINPTLYPV